MRIVAIMPVRNEDWCLGFTARALLRWVDHLVILDHASTDNTKRIASDIALQHVGRVRLLEDSNPVWREMHQRQWLLTEARAIGATHIAIVDADEIVTANLLADIRAMFATIKPGEVLQLPWLCLRSLDTVHTSGVWGEQNASTGFLDDPIWHWSAEGLGGYDHHHRHPMGRTAIPFQPLGGRRHAGLIHLQFVSERRLLAKQFWYQLVERTRWPDKFTAAEIRAKYSLTVHAHQARAGTLAPAKWLNGYEDILSHLHINREPWQLAEARRIIAENPGIEVGLNDFGVLQS